jgi:carbon-monoxide dehydrogenase medium subunit
VCRKAGEFALAIGAVYGDPERGVFRAVLGAINGPPIVIEDASAIFGGTRELCPSARLDEAAAGRLLAGSARNLDCASRRLHLTALSRAANEARTR